MNSEDKKKLLRSGAIVIVALLAGYLLGIGGDLLVGKVAVSGKRSDDSGQRLIGTKLVVEGVDWSKSQRTLVFALQAGCHFCSASGDFYHRLVEQRSRFGNTRLVAVLPQTLDDSRLYLNKIGFAADEIRQSPLSTLGVRGTPTLFLVNANGIITDTWTGKLSSARENNVIGELQTK